MNSVSVPTTTPSTPSSSHSRHFSIRSWKRMEFAMAKMPSTSIPAPKSKISTANVSPDQANAPMPKTMATIPRTSRCDQ